VAAVEVCKGLLQQVLSIQSTQGGCCSCHKLTSNRHLLSVHGTVLAMSILMHGVTRRSGCSSPNDS
jgi:hypothetical protein